MRKGMQDPDVAVQEAVGRDRFAGDVSVPCSSDFAITASVRWPVNDATVVVFVILAALISVASRP
ncbi:hypothetical protein ACTGJ9_038190 [Bradyrhizobium sp. RDM12]